MRCGVAGDISSDVVMFVDHLCSVSGGLDLRQLPDVYEEAELSGQNRPRQSSTICYATRRLIDLN